MLTILSEEVLHGWWQGLTLWYNHGDYQGAMQVWMEHVVATFVASETVWGDRDSVSQKEQENDIDKSSNNKSNRHQNSRELSIVDEIQNERQRVRNEMLLPLCELTYSSLHLNDCGVAHETVTKAEDVSTMAELLLFLAGCYLDASDPVTARHLTISCLALLEELLVLLFRDNNKNNGFNVDGEHTLVAGNKKLLLEELSQLYTRAIRECISTFQEDLDSSSAFWQSRQLLTYVLKNQQEQEQSSSSVSFQVPWTNSRQNPGFIYPLLAQRNQLAIYNPQDFEWCRILEDHWKEIRAELDRCLSMDNDNTTITSGRRSSKRADDDDHEDDAASSSLVATVASASLAKRHFPTHWPTVGDGSHRDGAGQHDGSVVNAEGSWKEWVLFGSGAKNHDNVNTNSNTLGSWPRRTCELLRKYCPEAVSLANDGGGGEVIFSVLAPHTRIAPHCGTTNLRLTAHLPLIVPTPTTTNDAPNNEQAHVDTPKCAIQVADEWLIWQEGKMIVFDDSFEHQVVNDTDSIRAVLLIRFWHPALSSVHQRQDAMQQALLAKQADALQRCNPPLPPCTNNAGKKAVTRRGIEQTQCPACWGTGYQSIRVDESMRTFFCHCGETIE